MTSFDEWLRDAVLRAEETVCSYLPAEEGYQKTVLEAMNYSVKAGGKRLRPLFLEEVYRMFGGSGREERPSHRLGGLRIRYGGPGRGRSGDLRL